MPKKPTKKEIAKMAEFKDLQRALLELVERSLISGELKLTPPSKLSELASVLDEADTCSECIAETGKLTQWHWPSHSGRLLLTYRCPSGRRWRRHTSVKRQVKGRSE